MNIIPRCLVALWPLLSGSVLAADHCQAKTPLETTYCSLLAKGANGLPALYEFRKNTPATQHLLLKRLAAKYSVTLPAIERKPTSTRPFADATPITPSKSIALRSNSNTASAVSAELSKIPYHYTTMGCVLTGETISCGNQHFVLQWNKSKNALHANALTAANRLLFPAETPPAINQDTYLLACFSLYLQKMIYLGLGNTTLSFNKFATIYATTKTQGVDFAARFERMYHFLKEERKTLQPPKGFGHAPPSRIEECQPVNETLWSCQTAEHHWVYAKK